MANRQAGALPSAMANIVVFQHAEIGPGRFGSTFRDHGFQLDIRRADLGDAVPTDLDDIAGLLVLGGSQNVTDAAKYSWMQLELEVIKKAHDRGLPVIGVCLGAQMIAQALGGTVAQRAGSPDLGFANVSVTIPGQTETMLAGVPWNHPQPFSCEQEIATLPPGATLLMSSKNTKNAAFKVGHRTFAFAFHPECDRPMVDLLWSRSAEWCGKAGVTMQDLAAQTDKHYATFARVADRLAVNQAAFAFSYRRLLGV
jgi:GMP synthase (glutamine-hydrolysing)